MRNCLIADNEDAGIFYEISYGLNAHDNVAVGNGFAPDPSAWGGQAGIVLSSSPNCVVTRNLLVGNREGFDFREQTRTTARIDNPEGKPEEPIWNHDERVCNNVIAYNRDAQTRGWFDVTDQRHWPSKLQTPARTMSLETLGNSHGAECLRPQKRISRCSSGAQNGGVIRIIRLINAIQSELNLENGSQLVDIEVLRSWQNTISDCRRQSAPFEMNCYPVGDVPGARVGKTEN